MDTKKITIIHLSVTAGLVILMEWAAKRAGAGLHWPEYAWLGTVRILEATALISYFIWAGPGANAMGLGRNRLFPGVLTGLIWSLCFAAIAAAGLGVLYLSGVNALTLFRMPLPAVKFEVFLFFLVGCLLGPFAEEVLFRGIIYGFIRRAGVWPAVFLSAVIFTLPHLFHGWFPTIQAAAGGIVFAVAYEKSGSLIAPFIIHSTGNAAIFSLALWQSFPH